MSFNDIITDYYNNKDLDTFFNNIAGDWAIELKQDVFLIVCEYDRDKIMSMVSKKQLKFFIIRVALNQYRSKHSKFYYQNFKNQSISISIIDDESIENADAILYSNLLYEVQGQTERDIKELNLLAMENSIDNLRYFEKEILKLYLLLGTYKKVSEETGIPIRSVANGVKNAINNVKLNTVLDDQ